MTPTATIDVQPVLRAMDDRPDEERAFRDEDGLESGTGHDDHVDPDDPPEAMPEGPDPDLESATRWRAANALTALREQVNRRAPNRAKASDGTIGDTRHCGHANATSDHCPRVVDAGVGVVCALDITHDPANGCDAHAIAEKIRLSRDSRVKYIISNGRIANFQPVGGAEAWAWRPYRGSNPHVKHCHISVRADRALFDSTAPWRIE